MLVNDPHFPPRKYVGLRRLAVLRHWLAGFFNMFVTNGCGISYYLIGTVASWCFCLKQHFGKWCLPWGTSCLSLALKCASVPVFFWGGGRRVSWHRKKHWLRSAVSCTALLGVPGFDCWEFTLEAKPQVLEKTTMGGWSRTVAKENWTQPWSNLGPVVQQLQS